MIAVLRLQRVKYDIIYDIIYNCIHMSYKLIFCEIIIYIRDHIIIVMYGIITSTFLDAYDNIICKLTA